MWRFLGFFIVPLFFSLNVQSFENSREVAEKLSKWDVSDIEADVERVEKGKNLFIDEMFDDLEAADSFFSNHRIDEVSALQMQRVALLTFLHDPMTYGAQLIARTYSKNKALFRKAANKLHPYDRKIIEEQLARYAKCLNYKDGCPQD